MNKWLILAASCIIMANAQANQSLCGYKDTFHLSNETPPGIFIVNGYSDIDVILQLVGARTFVVQDGYSCRFGNAHVVVADIQGNWCNLDIQDGPYMNHPTVRASCGGMNYIGTNYEGLGSFSYSIGLAYPR